MTDETIFRRLEPFGELDCVQVLLNISSKSILVTFRHLDSAMRARTVLSTASSWLSDVYFVPMDISPTNCQFLPSQSASLLANDDINDMLASAATTSMSSANEFQCPVLAILCDETFVPTQLWVANPKRDSYYLQVITAKLQQFGGTMTISKLRGFLRTRLNISKNIKSVPLKAMLSAYPGYFILVSNEVSLVSASPSLG